MEIKRKSRKQNTSSVFLFETTETVRRVAASIAKYQLHADQFLGLPLFATADFAK